MRAIGHKGADAIELDVLRPRADFERAEDWRRAPAGPVAPDEVGGPLVVAHDWGDARRRDPLTLEQTLDAFGKAPLDRVGIQLDLKIAGREDEVVAAIAARDLEGRASYSTQEIGSLVELQRLDPGLRTGWTLPRTTKDWNSKRWARPLVLGALITMRRRMPGVVRRRAAGLGVEAIWAYHALITPALLRACHDSGLELIAWTVDDLERMRQLAELGVDGICSNDPRLLARL
jgi:glycerophosphoryl diester phosphodiesterase